MVGITDASDYEDLLGRAAGGDMRARDTLLERLWPFLINRVRTRKAMRALRRSEDHVHNVVARIIEKLCNQEVMDGYFEWRRSAGSANFGQWIGTVIEREVISYVRQLAGRGSSDSEDGEQPISPKLLLNEFVTSSLLHEPGARPPITALQQARQLLQFAEGALPKEQCQALDLWLKGCTESEIDAELELEAGTGRKLMRAALATLRRRFGAAEDDSR